MSPGRRCLSRRASSESGGVWLPKSTITGTPVSCPAATARFTGSHSGATVVRDFDADDHARMLPDAHRGQPGVHVGEVLLDRPALHAGADDVDERQDARARAIDDLLLELEEVAPSRAARRRRASSGRCGTSGCRAGTAVSALLRYASFSVPKNTWAWMSMRPGTTCRPVASTTRRAWAGSMLAATRAIFVAGDGDIHDRVDAVCRIDDVAVLDQQVELRRLLRRPMHSRPRGRRQPRAP